MLFKVLKIAIPFVWFGMVLAISFMEAPLKFQAPGITIPLGLGIGRIVFFTLNKMEIVCALLLIIALWRDGIRGRVSTISIAGALVILVLESVWLLPALDVRAGEVIAGTAAPFSSSHIVYIVFDAVKLIALAIFGVATTRGMVLGGPDKV